MRIKCCKGCEPPKRHVGCHGTCSEYKEEKAVIDARKEELIKIRERNSDYKDYLSIQYLKHSKRKRAKR